MQAATAALPAFSFQTDTASVPLDPAAAGALAATAPSIARTTTRIMARTAAGERSESRDMRSPFGWRFAVGTSAPPYAPVTPDGDFLRVLAPRSGPAGPSECPCGDNQVPDESALDRVAVALDDEEKRRVGLLLLGKGAVSAHRFDRPRAAGLDERQQHEKRCSVLGTSAPSRHTRYSLRIDLDRCSELEAIARRPGPRGPG